MDIKECQEQAKQDYKKQDFIAHHPNGSRECRWLDAHFGLFEVKGVEGFVSVDDFPEGLECEHL